MRAQTREWRMSASSSTTRTSRIEALGRPAFSLLTPPVRASPGSDARLTGSSMTESASLSCPPYPLVSKSCTHVLLERHPPARNEPGKAGERFDMGFHWHGATGGRGRAEIAPGRRAPRRNCVLEGWRRGSHAGEIPSSQGVIWLEVQRRLKLSLSVFVTAGQGVGAAEIVMRPGLCRS